MRPPRPSDRPLLAVICISCVLAATAPGQPAPTVVIDVVDVAGRPLTRGTVTLCPADDACRVYRIDARSRVQVDRDLLLAGPLTILVHGTAGGPPLAAAEWSLLPAWRRLLTDTPRRAEGRLQILRRQRLTLTFASDLPPRRAAGDPPSPWLVMAGAAWLLGDRFGTDEDALGGGVEATVGPVVMLGRRLGVPRSWPAGRSSVGFVEVALAYAMNRYTVVPLEEATEADVAFHRVQLAVGVGRAWRHTTLALQAVIGYGGVYDGTAVLERAGRRYAMPAVGGAVRCSRRLATVAGLRLGLLGQVSVVHHGADPAASDHWYGFAPSIRLGLITD